MDVQVREARPEEDAAVGALLVRAFEDAYARHLGQPMLPERRAELADIATKRARGQVLVAESFDGAQEARLVGAVSIFRPGAEDNRAWTPETADLRQLAIAPDCQGQGLAGLLLDAAERQAWAWGARAICLHVRAGAQGLARMYQARGYQRAPQGDVPKHGFTLEAYWLGRA